MKLRHSRFLACILAIAVAVTGTTTAPASAAGSSAPAHRANRLDTKLRGVLTQAAPAPQRVIIRARPGTRATLQQSLTDHGDRILVEHASLEAFTAIVHGDDLGPLADNDSVLSISADAVVRPVGFLGGVLHLVVGTVGAVVTLAVSVVEVLLPNGADTSGPAVPPTVLRATLGLSDTQWTGRGIGVAVIDSGLEM